MLPAMVPALQAELESKIAGRTEQEVDDFLLAISQFALNARSKAARDEWEGVDVMPYG